jgi:hypothetical protein
MRSNIDNALVRGNIQTSAMLYLGEILAITANLAIASGGPMIIALDPANTGRNVSLYTPTTPVPLAPARDLQYLGGYGGADGSAT